MEPTQNLKAFCYLYTSTLLSVANIYLQACNGFHKGYECTYNTNHVSNSRKLQSNSAVFFSLYLIQVSFSVWLSISGHEGGISTIVMVAYSI